jgi:hypothetical protein
LQVLVFWSTPSQWLAAMAKGKRHSDPAAKRILEEKLARGIPFTEEDTQLLRKVARVDLMNILQENGYTLTSATKNSVANMIEFVIHGKFSTSKRPRQAPAMPVAEGMQPYVQLSFMQPYNTQYQNHTQLEEIENEHQHKKSRQHDDHQLQQQLQLSSINMQQLPGCKHPPLFALFVTIQSFMLVCYPTIARGLCSFL